MSAKRPNKESDDKSFTPPQRRNSENAPSPSTQERRQQSPSTQERRQQSPHFSPRHAEQHAYRNENNVSLRSDDKSFTPPQRRNSGNAPSPSTQERRQQSPHVSPRHAEQHAHRNENNVSRRSDDKSFTPPQGRKCEKTPRQSTQERRQQSPHVSPRHAEQYAHRNENNDSETDESITITVKVTKGHHDEHPAEETAHNSSNLQDIATPQFMNDTRERSRTAASANDLFNLQDIVTPEFMKDTRERSRTAASASNQENYASSSSSSDGFHTPKERNKSKSRSQTPASTNKSRHSDGLLPSIAMLQPSPERQTSDVDMLQSTPKKDLFNSSDITPLSSLDSQTTVSENSRKNFARREVLSEEDSNTTTTPKRNIKPWVGYRGIPRKITLSGNFSENSFYDQDQVKPKPKFISRRENANNLSQKGALSESSFFNNDIVVSTPKSHGHKRQLARRAPEISDDGLQQNKSMVVTEHRTDYETSVKIKLKPASNNAKPSTAVRSNTPNSRRTSDSDWRGSSDSMEYNYEPWLEHGKCSNNRSRDSPSSEFKCRDCCLIKCLRAMCACISAKF